MKARSDGTLGWKSLVSRAEDYDCDYYSEHVVIHVKSASSEPPYHLNLYRRLIMRLSDLSSEHFHSFSNIREKPPSDHESSANVIHL
jgi:hypothetical protein